MSKEEAKTNAAAEAEPSAPAAGEEMANEAQEEEKLHVLPPSLLDVMAEHDSSRCSRILVTARLITAHAKDKVGKHQQELVDKARIDEVGNEHEVSGIALVQSHSMLNMVEAEPSVIMAYLKLLLADLKEEDAQWALEDIRIVGQSEDCPSRQFPTWCYAVLQLGKEPDIDLESENVTSAAAVMFGNMSKLGQALRLGQGDSRQLEFLATNHAAILPSNERALAFCERDELFSVPDYLEFFDDPFQVQLASEKVWPLTRRMPY